MAARAAARIKSLQQEADSLASRERTLLEDLRKLEVERDLRAEEFAASTLDLQRIEGEIDDTAGADRRARADGRVAAARPRRRAWWSSTRSATAATSACS